MWVCFDHTVWANDSWFEDASNEVSGPSYVRTKFRWSSSIPGDLNHEKNFNFRNVTKVYGS